MASNTRREFLNEVGLGMLLAGLGTSLAKDLGKQFGFVLLALLILMMLIRPALKAATRPPAPPPGLAERVDEELELPAPRAEPTVARELKLPPGYQGSGMTEAQLLTEFPFLEAEDIKAALLYAGRLAGMTRMSGAQAAAAHETTD